MRRLSVLIAAAVTAAMASTQTVPAQAAPRFDVIIRGGVIYDGSGGVPYRGDVALRGDRIVAVGPAVAGKA